LFFLKQPLPHKTPTKAKTPMDKVNIVWPLPSRPPQTFPDGAEHFLSTFF
jgi:hypothetical protein